MPRDIYSASLNNKLNILSHEEKCTCQQCHMKFDSLCGLGHHRRMHKENSKDYYDKYFKEDWEGKCKTCGKETTFRSISDGYFLFCCRDCSNKNKDNLTNRKTTYINNWGVDHPLRNKEYKRKIDNIIKAKYGVDNISYHPKIQKKKEETCLKNHGVVYPTQSKEIIEKGKHTCLNNYGVEFYPQSKEYRKDMEDRGLIIPLDQLSELERYRQTVWVETSKHEEQLFKEWNGMDYYTNEKLILSGDGQHKLYPTIDHKFAIVYCFLNGIKAKECGDIKNLCICSRSTNSSKKIKTEDQFKKYLLEHKL